ncbi:MAG: IPT/TIG domain-containing protein [Sandaracinaceae bacterium]|nr:IPT/TIG domain-containing protein [Sandaracinaceae bacterium]
MLSPTRTLRFSALFAMGLLAAMVTQVDAASAQQIPVLERIEPTSGPAGTVVQVIGRAFDQHTRVLLVETQCEVISRLPNRWTVRIPPQGSTGGIVLHNRNGRSMPIMFTVTAAAAAPVIERVEPAGGAPGSEVVIRGQNFSTRMTDNVVMIGSVPMVVRSASPFEIRAIVPVGAVTGPITVRVGQVGSATSPQPFTVATGTAITDFQPRMGPPGTRVTITGSGFSATPSQNRVFMNNVPVRVERATPTSLLVSIPVQGASGPLMLDVRGGGRAQTPAPFGIQYAPTITSVAPISGPPGREVHIIGTNYGTDIRMIQATINNRPLVIRAITPTDITAEIPQGATTGRIAVMVGSVGPAQSPANFTVLVPVAITTFNPQTGPAGTLVTLQGRGFSPVVAENNVSIQDARCEVTSASASQLVVRIAGATSGTLEVSVANNGATRTASAFIVTRPPAITGFEPARLVAGTDVTIRGNNFGMAANVVDVTLGGRPLALVSVTDALIVARVPVGAVTGRLVVTVRLQGSATAASDLQVVAPLTLTSLEPGSGFPGSSVLLRGNGFAQTGTTVTFNGARSPNVMFVSPSEIRAVVPPNAQTGALVVAIPDGRSVTSAMPFTVVAVPAGVGITSIDVQCVYPGCHATIRGYGFNPTRSQDTVFFGDFPTRVTAATATSLSIDLPARPSTATFRVNVRGGGEAVSQPFTIMPR